MAVNRYKEHLVIYLEDAPYREIMNGVKGLISINERCLDVRQPARTCQHMEFVRASAANRAGGTAHNADFWHQQVGQHIPTYWYKVKQI